MANEGSLMHSVPGGVQGRAFRPHLTRFRTPDEADLSDYVTMGTVEEMFTEYKWYLLGGAALLGLGWYLSQGR